MTRAAFTQADVARDVPLRLAAAAALAFPDGSMTASGLRRERDRGRLEVEMIAGKEYTTLSAIERMRELCRVRPKESVSGSAPRKHRKTAGLSERPNGSSREPASQSPQAAALGIAQALINRHSSNDFV